MPAISIHELCKYADDTCLLVPTINNTYLILQEMDNITDWARANNLKLNSAKCCEIIISLHMTLSSLLLVHGLQTWS